MAIRSFRGQGKVPEPRQIPAIREGAGPSGPGKCRTTLSVLMLLPYHIPYMYTEGIRPIYQSVTFEPS